jgi:hypothetical protein
LEKIPNQFHLLMANLTYFSPTMGIVAVFEPAGKPIVTSANGKVAVGTLTAKEKMPLQFFFMRQ